MVQPQRPGKRPARKRAEPAQRRWRQFVRQPLLGLLLRGACLAGALAVAVRHPPAIGVAAAVCLWVLWPVYAVRVEPGLAQRGVPVRYLGGHPALRAPGRGWLQSWPQDGGAVLRVGRSAVAFPLAAVQAVSLHTGCRGPLAQVIGRALAQDSGQFLGLRRRGPEDVAVVDRSRVLCDLVREGAPCRVVLTGPRGGGEEIYLEVLVTLRPSAAGRGSGAAGGARGPGAAGGA